MEGGREDIIVTHSSGGMVEPNREPVYYTMGYDDGSIWD